MYWSDSVEPVSHRFRHEGERQGGMIIKQVGPMGGPPQPAPAGMDPAAMGGGMDPSMGMTPPPKSALGMLFDEIDAGIQQLGDLMGSANDLLSQARATNIDPQATMALQGDMEKMRQKQLSLTADISQIRSIHASLGQHGPPTADPMTAAMGQQAPMNMPPPDQASMVDAGAMAGM